MSKKSRRYSLKSKDIKILLNKVSEKLKINLSTFVDSKATIEAVVTDSEEIYLINGKPLLFRSGEDVLPTLLFTEVTASLPKAVVDMGAVPYVCNGADIMAPGIVRYEGTFDKGSLALAVDIKHGKPLALGEMLYNSEEAKNIKKGPMIKTKHYVSDKIWNLAKILLA